MGRFGYNRGAQLLRELRESLTLSQTRLGERLDLTQGAISGLERGLTGPGLVLAVEIERWARAHGVDLPPRAWCEPAEPEAQAAATRAA